jgi:4-oxalocrotonate tautomerase
MPIIHVLNASAADRAQNAELIARLTDTYAEVMKIRPDTIRVLIQELPRENWGVAGVALADSGQDESIAD